MGACGALGGEYGGECCGGDFGVGRGFGRGLRGVVYLDKDAGADICILSRQEMQKAVVKKQT